MPARELVVLGTASQAPTRTRNHNGYVLRWDGTSVLFDPGEGTQRQMVLAGVASPRIERLCVTHNHNDHCLGVPGVLARMALDAPDRSVSVHGPEHAVPHLRALVEVASTGLPVTVHGVPATAGAAVADVAGSQLTAVPLDHRVPAVGYRLQEPAGRRFLPERLAAAGIRGPDVGLLQRDGELRGVRLADVTEERPGQSFAFVMDTRLCEGVATLVAGVDLAVVESTFLDRDAGLAEQYAHLTARQAATAAARAGVRRLVLTHFSQRYGDLDEVRDEAEAAVAEAGGSTQVHVARDLDVVAVPAR
ncbi:MBL fold metallo-hydrolase [Kineococcus rubinsiae]|uniref:MBL fold metallo-hydrolase n=1 Tax=Kineococcus rubinsiae TaxID=2609562 RepID=UPI0014314DC6|nr:MBL fold metallo-hydrolase [Kineococcus rubinsiae]NIZ93148.1 MBL fold metallo-hydrolase [Kineococcus rubinsiae]